MDVRSTRIATCQNFLKRQPDEIPKWRDVTETALQRRSVRLLPYTMHLGDSLEASTISDSYGYVRVTPYSHVRIPLLWRDTCRASRTQDAVVLAFKKSWSCICVPNTDTATSTHAVHDTFVAWSTCRKVPVRRVSEACSFTPAPCSMS
jgi:hypothetical protein